MDINRDPEVFPYPNRPEENAQSSSNFHRFGLGQESALAFDADATFKIFLVQILSKHQLTLDSSIPWDENATRTKGLAFFTPTRISLEYLVLVLPINNNVNNSLVGTLLFIYISNRTDKLFGKNAQFVSKERFHFKRHKNAFFHFFQ